MEITPYPNALRGGAARAGAALASLWRPARTAPPGQSPLTRWAWAADVILAVVLSAATAYATANGGTGDGPFRGPSKAIADRLPPVPPVPPPPPVPGLRPVVGYVTESSPPPGIGLVLLAALTALPLAVRRRYPLGAYAAVLAAVVTFHWRSAHTWSLHGVDDPTVFTFVALLIAAYGAAVYSPYRRRAVVWLAVGALLLLIFHGRLVPDITPSFTPFVLLVPLGLAANTVHTWRQRLRAMEAEQEASTRLAVDQERARIARELHDVVTHNVSMMTVQAGAARTVLASEPEQARQALLAVESAGRAAMAELRHVMGLLSATTSGPEEATAMAKGQPAPGPGGARASGPVGGAGLGGGLGGGLGVPDVELAPQPGLGQVGVLAERVRGTGVPVDLAVTGRPVELPAGVDLAAYRVAQEALTNTVKHAAGASVTISVEYRPGEVLIEVADTGGTPSPAAATGNGRGLMGLRERLAVYGGTLDAGRRITGGYRVRAVIPVVDA